jgi:hypothetical protein
MFGHDWQPAEATILETLLPKRTANQGFLVPDRFVAEVRPAGSPSFRTVLKMPRIATDFWPPDVGDVVSVLVNADNTEAKFDKSDPRLSDKHRIAAKRAADVARFDAALEGSSPAPAPAPADVPGMAGAGMDSILASVREAQAMAGGDREAMAEMLRQKFGSDAVIVAKPDDADS